MSSPPPSRPAKPAGEDTRPGTYAEMAIVCCETSQHAPMTTAGAGLYMRVWARAFPDRPLVDSEEQLAHNEALESRAIDEHEAVLRRKLSQPWRHLDAKLQQGQLPL